MVRYVLGFAFDDKGEEVVLIQKRKPAWQAGKWNGVGGKVESGETSLETMVREFKEETSVHSTSADWRQFASMGSKGWNVDVFCAFNKKFMESRTNTPEQVAMFPSNEEHRIIKTISNLSWLIPMALNSRNDISFAQANVKYLSEGDVK